MVGEISPWHLLIVAIVFIVLFGSRKLPEASRSLGRSLRIFKSEMDGMKNEFKAGAADSSAAPTPQSPASPAQPPAVLPPVDQVTPAPAAQQPVAAAVPQDTPPEQPKA